jgi:uncharacterized iron-regulated membrane protein
LFVLLREFWLLFRRSDGFLTLRKAIFWIHLVIGVAVSVVVLMLSLTGIILTYEMQLNRWELGDYRAPPPGPGVEPLPIDELLHQVAIQPLATSPSSIGLRVDPREPAALSVGRGDYLFADRYTGEILNDGDGTVRRFLRNVTYWHRWLALEGDDRDIGRAITGAANLGFFFLLASGFYLLWPRKWTLNSLRNIITFRRGLKGKARDLNWHNVIGFWLYVPLLTIVVSGLVLSYTWAGDLVYRAVGEEPPPPVSLGDSGIPVVEDGQTGSFLATQCSYQTLFERAAKEVPDWKSITLALPESDNTPVVLTVDQSLYYFGGQPSKRIDLTFRRSDCAVHERGGYRAYSRGRKLVTWLRSIHTGEVYGFAGQTIAGVASIGGVMLVWTALAMAWRRFFR